MTGSEALLEARGRTEDSTREHLHGAQPYWRKEARTKGFNLMTKKGTASGPGRTWQDGRWAIHKDKNLAPQGRDDDPDCRLDSRTSKGLLVT